MYINPNHPNPPRRPEPPREEGVRLATFDRTPRVSNGKPPQEFRASLEHFQGSPYVALRVFEQNSQGQWWPVKGKSVSVRVAEIDELAEALAGVKDLVQQSGTRQTDPRDRPQGHADLRESPDTQAGSPEVSQRPGDRRPFPQGRSASVVEITMDDDRPQYNGRHRMPERHDPSKHRPTPKSSVVPFDEFGGT